MAREPARRERESEREDDTGSAGVVMVGGMDDLVDKDKRANDGEEQEERDEKPARRTETRQRSGAEDEEGGEEDRRVRRRDLEEDSRLAYDEEGDDLEERGQQSRRMRRNRSKREALSDRDMVIQGLAQKVEQLSTMLTSVGHNQMGLTLNSVEQQLSAAQQALSLADAELERAVTDSDGRKFREVQRLRDEAAARVFQLNGARARIQSDTQAGRVPGAQPRQQTAPQQQATAFGARAQDFTETFMSRFSYFDPAGTDEESLIIKGIDDAVAAEGYRPDTPLYWRTLEERLAKRGFLPDHMAGDDREDNDDRGTRRDVRGDDRRDDRPSDRSRATGGRPPTSSSRGGGRGGQATFRLHPMMVDHLRNEGLDSPDNTLSDEDKAKKHRLIDGWRSNERKAARGEFSRS